MSENRGSHLAIKIVAIVTFAVVGTGLMALGVWMTTYGTGPGGIMYP